MELVALGFRSSATKEVEIVVLGHQLPVLRRQVGRARFDDVDRALLAALCARPARPDVSLVLVRPETVLGWAGTERWYADAGRIRADHRAVRRWLRTCVV